MSAAEFHHIFDPGFQTLEYSVRQSHSGLPDVVFSPTSNHGIIMQLWHSIIMQPCHSITMHPCHSITMQPCNHATMQPCHHHAACFTMVVLIVLHRCVDGGHGRVSGVFPRICYGRGAARHACTHECASSGS
jgi:hypothetical protein